MIQQKETSNFKQDDSYLISVIYLFAHNGVQHDYAGNMAGVRSCLPFVNTWGHLLFFKQSLLLVCLIFCVVLCVFFSVLFLLVLCLVYRILSLPSWLPLRFSLGFMLYIKHNVSILLFRYPDCYASCCFH